MTVYRVRPDEFKSLSASAHKIAFKEDRADDLNRYTFCLVVADEKEIFAYATIIEMDKETAYMQHGGSMPNVKGTTGSKRCYRLMIEWLKVHYKRISTRVENVNTVMIKFALSEGLIIDGITSYQTGTYVSLSFGF